LPVVEEVGGITPAEGVLAGTCKRLAPKPAEAGRTAARDTVSCRGKRIPWLSVRVVRVVPLFSLRTAQMDHQAVSALPQPPMSFRLLGVVAVAEAKRRQITPQQIMADQAVETAVATALRSLPSMEALAPRHKGMPVEWDTAQTVPQAVAVLAQLGAMPDQRVAGLAGPALRRQSQVQASLARAEAVDGAVRRLVPQRMVVAQAQAERAQAEPPTPAVGAVAVGAVAQAVPASSSSHWHWDSTMAHYAELDTDNRVIRVLVVANDVITTPDGTEDEALGKVFLTDLLGGTWVQTSYNARIRARYAGPGYAYDAERDEFVPPGWSLIDNVWTAPPVEPLP